MRITVSVYQSDGNYYASRTFPSNMSFSPPGLIFSIAGEKLEDVEKEAKEEARRLKIGHVTNLD